MTREINFKLWSKQEKRMLTEKELRSYSIGAHDGHVLFTDGHNCNENYTKLQYTGYKDKNKNKIYEGDITRQVGHVGIGTITIGEYTDSYSGIDHIGYFIKYNLSQVSLGEFYNDIIIEGNIYENPDLIGRS